MGFAVSILLLAAGAVMSWGVNVDHSNGFNINTIGVILMVVGVLGLFISGAVYTFRHGDRIGVVHDDTIRDHDHFI